MSAARIIKPIKEREVIIIGVEDKHVLGTCVIDDYLKLPSLLGMPPLKKNISPVRFKALTGLDPRPIIRA